MTDPAHRRRHSFADYLDVEERSPAVKHEFVDGEIFANPTVVIEVLSPGTEAYDRNEKRGFYQQLASLRACVLVAQDRRRVELWSRAGDGWTHAVFGAGATVPLAAIGAALDVDELYAIAGVA